MDKKKELKLSLIGLDCVNCANKIEDRVSKLEGVNDVVLNFSTSTLVAEMNEKKSKEELIIEIRNIVKKLEPNVEVLEKNDKYSNKHSNNNDSCCTSDKCNGDDSKKCCGINDNKEHDHNHGEVSLKIKDNLRLIIGTIMFTFAFIVPNDTVLQITLFIISYILVAGKVVIAAIKNILRGEVFDENFLMTVASLGAFFIGEFPEGVAVMLFYEVGEMFQSYAVNNSRKSITSLMDIRADYANLVNGNVELRVSPEEVNIGDVIIVKPGERVPLDGIIIDGRSFMDTSALTGESVPREVTENNEILAGCINTSGVLKVKVTKDFGDSTVARILELVENASNKKAPTEKFITKFSKKYTPTVVFCALALAIIPPFIIQGTTFSQWISRACVFLVVSCPCALVISIPLGLFSGIGGESKKGVLVKGGNYLEALKDVDTIVFDKTGTLTKGVFKVTEINAVNIEKDELLKIAAFGESLSNHPIAQSIVKDYGKSIDKDEVKDYQEVSGHGIKVTIKDDEVLLGNYKLMDKFNIKYNQRESIGTTIHIAINSEYKGNIIISDEIKENVIETIKGLKEIGIKKTVMLTGDNKAVAEKVSRTLGIDEVYSELLPVDKVEKIESIIMSKRSNGNVAFVGDGINDAPVLARADIGIAMGGIGSDAAIEAADVVLMNDEPKALIDAIKVARKTNKILWQNIIFSLGVKIFVLMLGAFGIATMWEAVFADVGVTILAVLNSSRCLK